VSQRRLPPERTPSIRLETSGFWWAAAPLRLFGKAYQRGALIPAAVVAVIDGNMLGILISQRAIVFERGGDETGDKPFGARAPSSGPGRG
jgi:hypothetical protein